MGIPSYYRFLYQRNKKIIKTEYAKKNSTLLCLDFNCIVYYCLSKIDTYVDDASYESQLIREVCKYVEHIWRSADKPDEVFIAVDGVVPMAKMKQQRLRRFKSIFLEPYELECGAKIPGQKSWDKNSITPGTLFMKKLDTALNELCKSHKGWSCSGYANPGEGEHKVMRYINSYKSTDNSVLVYGLDADLILLSMKYSFKQNIYLMREEMEFNSVVKDVYEKEQFLYLCIESLKKELFINPEEKYVDDYIMMMSLLGNDFVPHSISVTIKDGGYVILYNLLKEFHKHNKFLLNSGKIQWSVLKEFIGRFMNDEESMIENMCKKKKHFHTFKGKTDYELKMASVYALPAKWSVESSICNGRMIEGWEEIYYSKFLHNDKNRIIREYLKGLQWIIDYYSGRAIEFDWYYPFLYVPLWKDIYNYMDSNTLTTFPYTFTEPIEPEQQLVLVLPLHSYNLIQNPKYKNFPTRFPQFFPTKFKVHSLGKKWIYECESDIPIITSKFLRKISN
jgi:5'-3' exonuclease